MHIFLDFLLNLFKALFQIFAKTCAEKYDKNKIVDIPKKKPRKRTTSVSKTETVVIETVSESVSDSPPEKEKKKQ